MYEPRVVDDIQESVVSIQRTVAFMSHRTDYMIINADFDLCRHFDNSRGNMAKEVAGGREFSTGLCGPDVGVEPYVVALQLLALP